MKHLLTTLALSFSALYTCAFDFAAPNADGITLYYNILNSTDNTVALSIGATAYRDNITIPDTVTNGNSTYTVTAIGKSAFYSCRGLLSVDIPATVTTIDNSAFYYCTQLKSIELPPAITSIGDMAFYGCSLLEEVTIPESVVSIGAAAFSNCENLIGFYGKFAADDHRYISVDGVLKAFRARGDMSFTIPDGITTIDESAFAFCTELESITFSSSVRSIKSEAFSNCNNLSVVSFNNDLKSIGTAAFSHCDNLCEIEIPDSVTYIGSMGFYSCKNLLTINLSNSLKTINAATFAFCNSLQTIVIPESIAKIDAYAFQECSALKDITIGKSVTTIERDAFTKCTALETVRCEAVNPPTCFDQNVFYLKPTSCVLEVPLESIDDYAAAIGWSTFHTIKPFEDFSGIGITPYQAGQRGNYYNLRGIRINNPSKGIFIHNGAKILVR